MGQQTMGLESDAAEGRYRTMMSNYKKLLVLVAGALMRQRARILGTHVRVDIADRLFVHIDAAVPRPAPAALQVPHPADHSNAADQGIGSVTTAQMPSAPSHDAPDGPPPDPSELFKHFKNSHVSGDMTVSERLQASTFEHVHAVLRFSRQGSVRTARLHARLANDSLERVSHFLATEEFHDFRQSVEVYIEHLGMAEPPSRDEN